MPKKFEKWIKPKSPVAVELYDPNTRKYSYIDELETIPTKKTIQRIFVPHYGPGKYRVTDSTTPEGQVQVWTVAEDLMVDHNPPEIEEPSAPQVSAEEITERAVAAALEQMNRYRAPVTPSYAPPAPAPAHHATPSGPDPYTVDVLRRLDTAMHQIQSQVMNLENTLSRVMFEIQQVPARVGIDVRAAVSEAGDPEERVANLWAMLQDMQEGNIVGEDSTPSWLKALGSAMGGLAGGQMAPPMLQAPAALPANGQAGDPSLPSADAFGPLSSIPGIDAERAEAIVYLSQMLGQSPEVAARMAQHFGMDADQLIAWGKEQVRAAQAAQAQGKPNEQVDTNGTGPEPSAGRSGTNGEEVGDASGV